MNYSKKEPITKSVPSTTGRGASAPQDEARKVAFRMSFAHSLTTYKDVVYNIAKYQKDYEQIESNLNRIKHKRTLLSNFHSNKLIHYGLTNKDLEATEKKLIIQKAFLNTSVLYDKITGNTIPLRDMIISANHSPHRYYGEVQNRVNTLIDEADRKELVPVFMTLTLPSEYHPFKTVIHQGKKTLIENSKYNGTPPNEAVKILTKRFAKFRNDRALRDIGRDSRIYYRVNEPHKSGTPHTHILYYVPQHSVNRVMSVFKRLFPQKGNDIQKDIRNSASYLMKYINKTLPKSKGQTLSKKEKFLNAWYAKYKITRFSSSRTLAPLYLYRLLYKQYSLRALTRMREDSRLRIFASVDEPDKILEIFDGDELIYMKNENFSLELSHLNYQGVA